MRKNVAVNAFQRAMKPWDTLTRTHSVGINDAGKRVMISNRRWRGPCIHAVIGVGVGTSVVLRCERYFLRWE